MEKSIAPMKRFYQLLLFMICIACGCILFFCVIQPIMNAPVFKNDDPLYGLLAALVAVVAAVLVVIGLIRILTRPLLWLIKKSQEQ